MSKNGKCLKTHEKKHELSITKTVNMNIKIYPKNHFVSENVENVVMKTLI